MTPNREIRMPGDIPLPPSIDPLPPADIKPDERVRVSPPCPPWRPTTAQDVIALRDPHFPLIDRRFWRLQDSFEEPPRGIVAWKNDPGPGLPRYGSGHGIHRLPDPAIFEVDPHKGALVLPDMWEGFGLYIVSSRFLEVLLDADADAITHKPIIMRDLAGRVFDDDHHFMDVVRIIPAVDYANSVIDYIGGREMSEDGLLSFMVSYVSSKFVDDLDPRYKIFRQAGQYGGRGCFVSEFLRQQIEAAVPPVRNVAFHPLYSGF